MYRDNLKILIPGWFGWGKVRYVAANQVQEPLHA